MTQIPDDNAVSWLAVLVALVCVFAFKGTLTPFGLSALTVILGNLMGQTNQNNFVGVRLPWTLASADNWNRTHRFARRAFVIAGIISLVWVSLDPHIVIPLVAMGVASGLTVSFSYRYFKSGSKIP